jgi:hypothetical protein
MTSLRFALTSPKLQAWYSTDTFTVLVVAPTETRLQCIAAEVIKVTRQPSPAYLFTTENRIQSNQDSARMEGTHVLSSHAVSI